MTVNIQELAQAVAEVRRLPLGGPVRVTGLRDEDFTARMLAKTGSRSRQSAFMQGLGFDVPGLSGRSSERRLLEDTVAAFYDPHEKALFVRGSSQESGKVLASPGIDREVLAHEIEHAIQDRNFDLTRVDDLPADEARAFSALFEGDAVFVSYGVAARYEQKTADWVQQLGGLPEDVWAKDLSRYASGTKAFQRAPTILRRELLFPYVDGLRLVLALVRNGGFELLDEALRRPPRSTEQVLHPEKYLAGEEPVPVDRPLAPVGWKILGTGRFGELETSIFLSQCMAESRAQEVARGWGGDAWALTTDEDNTDAMLWSTVWDDEDSAIRFEQALGERASCASSPALLAGANAGRGVRVLREGKRVAYTQGLPDGVQEVATRALLSLPFPPPQARPLR